MGFREALQSSHGQLTDSERRIGTVLLNDSQGAPLLTAAELARHAQVHESTVVRFAQKLGYAGYIALRLDLAAETTAGPRRRPQPTGEETSLARVVRAQSEILSRLEDDVSQRDIDAAMAATLRAQHTYVVGDGLVGPVAEFFARKAAILQLPASLLRQTGEELRLQLGVVRSGDAVIVFVLSTEYPALRDDLAATRARGATLILITDQPIHTHQPEADFVLAVPRSELHHGVFVSLATVAYAMDYSLMEHRRAAASG